MSAGGSTRTPPTIELLTRVASMYYLENRTQEEIAGTLKLSRATVGRLLQRGREVGIVQITVNLHPSLAMPLEAELVGRFGLQGAVVVGDDVDEDAQRASLGRAAAELLDRTLAADEVVAIGMGRNVRSVAQQSRGIRARGGTVVSAIGGSALFAEGLNSNEIATLLAESLGAKAEGLYAPAYAETAEVRGVFLRHDDVARTLAHARSADVAIVGVGDADSGSLVVRMGAISVGDMTRMRRDGAVGDILGAFFDIDGAPSAEYIQERVVGILRDELARIPRVIAVVSEASKTASTLGALRSGLVHTLVTTARLAQAVLAAE